MMIERAYYEGKGLYASLTPTQSTLQKLQSIYLPGQGLSPIQWHVTVSYDPKFSVSPHAFTEVFAVSGADMIYDATVIKETFWEGSNGKIYKVLLLHSPQIVTLHNYLKEVLKIDHGFPTYAPHMTLAENCVVKGPDNDSLAGTKVSFGGFRIEDVK